MHLLLLITCCFLLDSEVRAVCSTHWQTQIPVCPHIFLEMERLEGRMGIPRQVQQHYQAEATLRQKQIPLARSVRVFVGSTTSQSIDYIG